MTETHVLRVEEEIVIEASPEWVFRALTDPEEIPRWWTDGDRYGVTSAEIDLREGGRYRLSGTSERLGTFEVVGTFLHIDRPHRLAYSWTADWDDGARDSRVEYELTPVDGGTRVRVRHTGIAAEASRDEYAGGWPTVLSLLKQHAGEADDA